MYIHFRWHGIRSSNTSAYSQTPKKKVFSRYEKDSSPTERLDHFIHDIVTNSMDKDDILMSEPVAEAMTKIRQFMFERVYKNPIAKSEEGKAEMLMETLYQHFLKHLDDLPEEYLNLLSVGEPREKVVCDYVGAMTDRFAIAVYEDIYIPKSWQR